jgi:tetratricopeptide (TPR) repeat protein
MRCEMCQTQVRAQREALGLLAQLRAGQMVARTPQCPPEDAWFDLAVGVAPDPQTLLHHAAGCDHCAPLLQQAISDLTGDWTADEESKLGDLASAKREWQKVLAQRLATGVDKPAADRLQVDASGFRRHPRRAGFWTLYAVAAVVLMILTGVLVLHRFAASSPQTLLASAYTERRTLELRIPGAKHAPMHLERGAGPSCIDKPSSLLQAEAVLAEQLQKQPEDPKLLDAKARADLMDGNFDAAVETLERAVALQPDSLALKIDLATAYFQQAEAGGQVDGYRRALATLGTVLAAAPNNSVASFNRAITEERLSLYPEALSEWEHFVRVESDSAWRDEGRERREKLQQMMQER